MYRQIIFVIILAKLILNSHAASTAKSRSDPMTSEPSRQQRIIDFEDSKDHAQRLHTEELEQLGSIAYAFRNQFRDVIEELIIQAFKYLRTMFNDIKVRLFKRLGRYTLSDLFHATFDGVADFVVDATTDTSLVFNAEEELSRPSYAYSHYPYVPPHPYSMRADGMIVNKIINLKEVFKKSLQATRGGQNDAKEQNSNTSLTKEYQKNNNKPDTKENKILMELHNPANHHNNVNSIYLSTPDEKEKMLLSFLPDVRDFNDHETLALKMEILTSIQKLKQNRGSILYYQGIMQSAVTPKIMSIRPTSNGLTTISLSQSLPSTTTATSMDRSENYSFPELVLVNS